MKGQKSQSIKLTKSPKDGTGALKEGSFRIFYHRLLQNIKKLNGENNLVEKKFRKKSHNAEKN